MIYFSTKHSVSFPRFIEGFSSGTKTTIRDKNTFKDAPMFLINLDRRHDRLATTVKLLNDKGYAPLTRVKATDGNAEWDTLKRIVKDDVMQPIHDGYRTAHNQLSKGGVGCYMSHLKLWNYLSKSDHEAFIIFEDDTLPSLTRTELMTRLSKVPDDWDLVLFGAIYDNCRNVNEHVCRISRFVCLHAYAIRKRMAIYMVPKALPIEQQIDWWISDMAERKDINIYSLIDTDWNQNENVNTTDIQTPMVGDEY
jgi:GR25 family glycosyltransferase involved in LPS biosynthesis